MRVPSERRTHDRVASLNDPAGVTGTQRGRRKCLRRVDLRFCVRRCGTIRSSCQQLRLPAAFCWAGSSPCNCWRRRSRHADSVGTAQAAPWKPRRRRSPLAETTGSAPAGESVASADCEQQTWPHLSRVCMEEYRSKNRSPRVVTTDKLDKPTIAAIETQPPPVRARCRRHRPSPSAAGCRPPAPLSTDRRLRNARLCRAAAGACTGAGAAERAVASPAAKNEAKEKRVAKKSKRKPKGEPRAAGEAGHG